MSADVTPTVARGGSWLFEAAPAGTTFTPESFSDEQRLIAQTADEFVQGEVLPGIERMESKDWPFVRQLLRQCGELGLLGSDVPESLGGVALDKVSSVLVSERMARNASMAACFGTQTNLAILSILLFGTDAQKQRYVPRLAAGEIVGAYALSESGAGSDALAAKTRADRQADGGFILNGEKMWITNGGFADVITVFAKVDGEAFTAFLVERAWPGVSSGKEEHKLGIHGSSTTPIVLQDVRVPPDAVLGQVGKGHRVAFNVLNFGRLKLGAACTGGVMHVVGEAARYAAERHQFGQAIATFGAIRHKLGQMTAALYGMESLLYRTAGMLEAFVAARRSGPDDMTAMLAAGEEYAIEASIAKVAGSETADFIIDENLQIHGGNGFVRDYPAERHYRDARVNRIFEGTNEVNRLLIPGLLLRRGAKGDLPLMRAARALQDELLSPSLPAGRGAAGPGTEFQEDLQTVAGMKKVAIALLGLGMLKFGEQVGNEQELLMTVADVVIDTYQSESALLRAMAAVGAPDAPLHAAAARVCLTDAAARVEALGRQGLAVLAEGDALRTQLAALRRLLKPAALDTITMRRVLADATVAKGRYLFRD